jgi:hypothetical protein
LTVALWLEVKILSEFIPESKNINWLPVDMKQQYSLFESLVFDTPINAFFAVEKKVFLNALRQVRKAIQFGRSTNYTLELELLVFDGRILLRLMDNEYWIDTPTSKTCSVRCYYHDLLEAVKHETESSLEICFTNKRMTVNKSCITMLNIDFNIDAHELPLGNTFPNRINYNSYEPSHEKHFFNNARTKGFLSETIQKDIRLVTAALKKYDIPRSEIEHFVHSYLTLRQL